MGARNFKLSNTGMYNVVCMEDEYRDLDDFQECSEEIFAEKDFYPFKYDKPYTEWVKNTLFAKDYKFTFCGVAFNIEAFITYDIGYCEGVNLDVEFRIDDEFNWFYEEEYAYSCTECMLERSWDWEQKFGSSSNGMIKLQLNNLYGALKKFIQAKIDEEILPLLGSVSEEKVTLTSTFSNGEGVYKRVA